MLIIESDYKLVNIECMPGSDKLNLIWDLNVDLGDLLPYLAAEIKGCTYIHGTDQLNYMEGGHIIVIRPRQITVTALKDRLAAEQMCKRLKTMISGVYQRRDSIQPVLCKRVQLDPLTVYRALPRTNCAECGELTCMAFAARVVNRELPASHCAPLRLEENRAEREKLWRLLMQAEYEPEWASS